MKSMYHRLGFLCSSLLQLGWWTMGLALMVGTWLWKVPHVSAQPTTCLKPNLLLVLDKSGSMLQDNKWVDAQSGINSNTQTYSNRLRYGLITFSNANQVNVDAPIPSTPTAIQTALSAITPSGDTYMVPAIAAARKEIERDIQADAAQNISGRPSSIIFITDGAPSDSCPIQEVNALRSLVVNGVKYDVKTYVIGFGSNVNPICLNNLATAGGTDLPGSIKYYVASNATFSAAVSAIANSSASEVCNGLDDDCDGTVDNVKNTTTALSQSCTLGKCTGTQVCSGGKWATCQPNPPAQPESCNNLDDDCDGYIDNDQGKSQDNTLTRTCQSSCGTGTETCIGGAWRNCSAPQPATEICDGKDNDCDGQIDNIKNTQNPIKQNCTVGRCLGEQVCANANWATCQPKTTPSPEACNGLDDDCDGYIDNASSTTKDNTFSLPCRSTPGTTTYTCMTVSRRNCSAPQPATEICDGKDNDCDGQIDNIKNTQNPIKQNCTVGRCLGEQVCSNAKWATCQPKTTPTTELCNNQDDDCDGYIDNKQGDPRNNSLTQACTTACGSGTETCISGQWRNCTAAPLTEVCNGKDDDCDGEIDNIKGTKDPLKQACSVGRCQGEQVCTNATWAACQPKATPATETCNNQDDDCDGYIDNASGVKRHNSLTQPCQSACGTGTETCISGAWRNCTVAPQTEVCNGKDDDCDGQVDNVKGTTTPLSETCSVGRCSGKRTCSKGAWTACQPDNSPAAEVCNNQDDDCDGYIDNAKGSRTHYSLTQTCTSSCGTGTEQCIQGVWRNCTVAPQTETCNGKDDDCDGQVDNIKGTTNPLGRYCVTGGCAGEQPCIKGNWGVCQPKATSQKEVCNGRDDDCDGFIDNKPGDTANYTLTQPCNTACGTGIATCISGAWRNCTAPPVTAEVCNGKDDNCDGRVDETWASQLGKPCTNLCGAGVIQCRPDGRGVECVTPQQKPEVCDGIDNNCDGQIDEDWPDKGKLCVSGSGACQKTGLFLCKLDQSGIECSAKSPNQPSPEVCDGIDNNCDGKVDENLRRPCSSPCGSGDEICQEGTWSSCTGGSGSGNAQPEVCDNKDNDCDGYVDNQKGVQKGNTLQRPCKTACGTGVETCVRGQWESCTAPQPKTEECNGVDDDCDGKVDGIQRPCATQCGRGTETCINGVWGTCSVPEATPEVCDGKDNNCDGQVDENLVAPCKTACGEGKEICLNGKWQFCDAPQPKPEECNGIDDDCNGTVDDGLKPIACQGACGSGTASCVDGKWTGCTGGPQPTPEICDGKDNDCDGKVDGIQRPCRTSCGEGHEICLQGVWGGCLAPHPETEKCDGKDNDCNGIIDENAVCPDGYACLLGACRRNCRGGECPAGQRCVSGACVAIQPCEGIRCPAGLVCKNDKCTDGCDDVTCPSGKICRNGQCYDPSCYAYGCALGKRCVNGVCVDDPCADVKCKTDQFCREGKCVGACTQGCAVGETCLDGYCVPDPCAKVSCQPGERCEKGSCVQDDCAKVTCPAGKICTQGKCEHDPCYNITCPEFTRCVAGQCVGKPQDPEVTPENTGETGDSENTNTPEVVTDGGPSADDPSTSDKIGGQEIAPQQADTDPNAVVGCGCLAYSLPVSGWLWFALFFLVWGRIFRRPR